MKGETQDLPECVDEVSQKCDVRRAFDKALRLPEAVALEKKASGKFALFGRKGYPARDGCVPQVPPFGTGAFQGRFRGTWRLPWFVDCSFGKPKIIQTDQGAKFGRISGRSDKLSSNTRGRAPTRDLRRDEIG